MNKSDKAKLLYLKHHLKIPSTLPLAKGGNLKEIEGFRQYDTGSHKSGKDLAVDANGIPSAKDAVAEVQNKENMYKGYVYSDTLKNPETGNTFNVDLASIIKKYSDASQDQATKNTLDFKAKRLAVANDMEKAKASIVEKGEEMGYGGKVKKMFNGGGISGGMIANSVNMIMDIFKKPEIEGLELYGKDPNKLETQYNVPVTYAPSLMDGSNAWKDKRPVSPTPDLPDPQEGKDSTLMDLYKTGLIGKGVEFATKAINAFRKDDTGESPVNNPYESDIKIAMANMGVDDTAALNNVSSTLNAELDSIRKSTRSPQVKKALELQAFANAARSKANVSMQTEQLDNRIAMQKASVYDSLGQQQVRAQNIANDIKSKNIGQRAMNFNALGESVGNAAEWINNMGVANMTTSAQINILSSMFPNYEINASNVQDIIKAIQNGEPLTKFKSNA